MALTRAIQFHALTSLLGIHSSSFVQAWIPQNRQRAVTISPAQSTSLQVTKDEWSTGDDWTSLTSEHHENASIDTSKLFNQDLALNAARDIEAAGTATMSSEDHRINDVVDRIHNDFSSLDETPLYDTEFEEDDHVATNTHSTDEMGDEIAMLVRCDEQPKDLLISEGRALLPLTEQEKNDVSQLVRLTEDKCEATNFLRTSVSIMFSQHASPDQTDGVLSMDRKGVAKWMTQALKSEKGSRVSAHESCVLKTISDFGTYGTGRLLEDELQALYLSTVVGDTSNLKKVSPTRHLQLRQPFLDVVWRDIRNHGILSPVEKERKRLAEEIQAKNGGRADHGPQSAKIAVDNIMDECEILDWDYRPQGSESTDQTRVDQRQASGTKSSHKLLEMTPDKKTPLRVRDGEFGKCFWCNSRCLFVRYCQSNLSAVTVFIDEESCIGCNQVR
jgi:hypothetical protein